MLEQWQNFRMRCGGLKKDGKVLLAECRKLHDFFDFCSGFVPVPDCEQYRQYLINNRKNLKLIQPELGEA